MPERHPVWVRSSLPHAHYDFGINDDESGLHYDCEWWLEEIAPHEPVDQHHYKADAKMKRQVLGHEVVVAVTEGKLDFGTWEQIFYGEFSGGRRKRVW